MPVGSGTATAVLQPSSTGGMTEELAKMMQQGQGKQEEKKEEIPPPAYAPALSSNAPQLNPYRSPWPGQSLALYDELMGSYLGGR